MSVPGEVVGMIQEIEEGKVPIMVKICSGKATEEEIDQWMVEQQIPQEEKEEVLSMLTNSFSTGGMLAEKIYSQNPTQTCPMCYDNIDTEVNNKVETICGGCLRTICDDCICKYCSTCTDCACSHRNAGPDGYYYLGEEPGTGFPGSGKTDIINRLKLVLSEIDTLKSQVTTLIDQVSLLK